MGAPGNVLIAAREASPAPGVTGATFDGNDGIWAGVPGGLQLVLREGDQAPGTPSGVTFSTGNALLANATGQVAVVGNLKQTGSVTVDNDKCIWAGTPGSLVLAAREGSQAP